MTVPASEWAVRRKGGVMSRAERCVRERTQRVEASKLTRPHWRRFFSKEKREAWEDAAHLVKISAERVGGGVDRVEVQRVARLGAAQSDARPRGVDVQPDLGIVLN
jgi:hypothetical protein